MNNPSAPLFLFHRPDFIFRNGKNSAIHFHSPHASIYFTRSANALLSLDKAPFGSFILDHQASIPDLTNLIKQVEDWCRSHDICSITIRCFAEIYGVDLTAVIRGALCDAGFAIKYRDITQLLSISQPLHLDVHKKRRLKKCLSLDYTFRQLTTEFLEESYCLITGSRKNKGYPITMTKQQLDEMFTLFPEEYFLFGVFDKNKMIATSVCIKITSRILYSFYIGDSEVYRSYSPVTLLISEIYSFCKLNQFQLLDLGISTDKGALNKGLYSFKKSFGSFDSDKLTFEKQL